MQQAVRGSLIAFMGATAQAQSEIIKEAQKAGIAHAQAHHDGMKYRGRKPTFSRNQAVSLCFHPNFTPRFGATASFGSAEDQVAIELSQSAKDRDHELAVGCGGVTQRFKSTARFHDSVEGIQKITS